MMIDYRLLGQRLAKIRKQRKLTQERLAEMTDLANNYISNIENGRSIPSLETLAKLCEALDVTPNEFLMGTVHDSETYCEQEIMDDYKKCTAHERRLVQKFIAMLIDEREK